ncbi:alpha/beta hydrolase family protein [Aliikangiella maris]|uniref:Alpha/beta fold hydrolase n=2 Tax=Aliikangiella maris TaxID=3162458 RepID=A0ABV3MK81_9GAMM
MLVLNTISNKFLLGLTLLISFSLNANTDSTKQPIPHTIEDFAQLPGARNAQISPDGKHFALVFRSEGEEKLAIFQTDDNTLKSVFYVRGIRRSVGDVNWVTNERLVYGVNENYAWDRSLRDTGELIAVNVDGSFHKMIFGYKSGQQQLGSNLKRKQADYGHHEIIDLLEGDDKHILIIFYPWKLSGNVWRTNIDITPAVYKLNIYSGKRRFVTRLNVPLATAITDTKGKVRFAVGEDKEGDEVVSYREKEEDEWQNFKIPGFKGKYLEPLSFTKDNKGVYVSARINNGTRALFEVNLKDRSFSQLFHDPQVDPTIFIKDYSKRRVVAVGTELALPDYHYLDKKDPKAKLHAGLLEAFPGYDVVITSSTKDGKNSIIFVYSDKNSGDYYLFNSATYEAKHLMSKHAWLDPKLMASMKAITIQTRDKKEISAYLTAANHQQKQLPLIVMPHGGPHGVRDYWGYDWEVQLLASKGYAVLQVNYRGSGGFGYAFEQSGYGKWGTLMQDDVTDATLAMIEQGIADKNKICIYGASYGGYAALMGAVREPDLYKCTIGSVGVYDLPMMFEEGDIADSRSGLNYLKKVLGTNVDDQKARSPVYNVDKIKANILLIHGKQDERVPIEQAEALMDALDDIDKKYEWLKLVNEGHGYYDVKSRIKVYRKIIDFLDRNIGS